MDATNLTFLSYLRCFMLAWKEHSSKHSAVTQNISLQRLKSKNFEQVDLDIDIVDLTTVENTLQQEYIEGQELHRLSITEENKAELWQPVYHEHMYVPATEDVGCCLKIECRAIANTGDLLGEPVIIFTEPVLASPQLAFRRSLLALPGGNIQGTRLRIASYNTLAEVYATRQV